MKQVHWKAKNGVFTVPFLHIARHITANAPDVFAREKDACPRRGNGSVGGELTGKLLCPASMATDRFSSEFATFSIQDRFKSLIKVVENLELNISYINTFCKRSLERLEF